MPDFIKKYNEKFDQYVQSYDIVSSLQEYEALSAEQKASYHSYLMWAGDADSTAILGDQAKTNTNLKWAHNMSIGLEGLLAQPTFAKSDITLTNSKGAYS